MFNNAALDVVIGLIFVYLLYSLLGTLLQEIVATKVGLRATILQKAIRRMLDDSAKKDKPEVLLLSDVFYSHPLIKYLAAGTKSGSNKPSYITHDTFSKVVIDLLRGKDIQAGQTYNLKIQESLSNKKIAWAPGTEIEVDTSSYLNSLWVDAQGDVQKFKMLLEQWFDQMMERTTGWYKKQTQFILLCVGLIVAVVFNVDTIKITKKLENNPKLRAQIVSQASDFAKSHPKGVPGVDTGASKAVQDSLNAQALRLVSPKGDVTQVNDLLALGWQKNPFEKACEIFCINGFWNGLPIFLWKGFLDLLGWLLTALAISLGAPFWFDLLNKLMQLRSSVDNSKEEDKTKKKTNTSTALATETAG